MSDDPEGAVILLYHGVTNAVSEGIENFSGKHLAANEFTRQMAWLAANAHPMRLNEMAEQLVSGEGLPPRSFAVTFDDSYRNKAHVALPILKQHGIPATFFISTGFVGTDRVFWTDRIEHALGWTKRSALRIRLDNGVHDFPLNDAAQRIDAVDALKRAMKLMPPVERDRVLTDVESEADVQDDIDAVENYQLLDWDGVRTLDEGADYEVGGHSVNHEVLSTLNPAELNAEIDGCLNALSRELNREVRSFSYPEGQPEHYNETVVAALKRRGIRVCPSAIHGVNRPGADPFHLRRIMVGFVGAAFPFPAYSH